MPNLNPDEAANDERKIFNDESVGEEDVRGWQDSELNKIKDDLVDEDNVEPVRQSYDNKVSTHRNGDVNHRSKDDLNRSSQNDMGSGRPNFSYTPQQDFGSIVSGLGHPLFPNVVLPPSSQVPYSPYVPYMNSLLYANSSPTDIDNKQVPSRGSRPDVPSMYSLPGQLGQIPNPLAPWSPSPLYPLCTASAMAGMLPYPYPFHSFSTAGGMGSMSPFPLVPPNPHGGGMHHSMLPHAGLPMAGHMMNGQGGKPGTDKKDMGLEQSRPKRRENKSEKPSRPYVKKPLNAFMIYMKEKRAQVVAECTLKESAAINQILGRKWHSLDRSEQQKYYDMARKERQIHMEMFPGWSARDNYGKRKKRKKEKTQDCTAQNPKKCRAVFGLEQQQLWRKKKCIRYQHDGDDSDDDSDESPRQYQGSPEGPFPHQFNHTNSFDGTEHSLISQSSTSGIANSNNSSQSGASFSHERLSPHQSLFNDQIKQEKSPPNPQDSHSGSRNKSMEMFHPPTSDFRSSPINVGASDNCAKKPSISNETSKRFSNGKDGDFSDTSNHFQPQVNGSSSIGKSGPEHRNRRLNLNHPESSIQSRQTMFNSPILSPNSMGLNSPHANHSLFPHFTYLAAASPLGGIMGFPGFKGLDASLGMGLSGGAASGTPSVHPGANASRHVTSALEGKS